MTYFTTQKHYNTLTEYYYSKYKSKVCKIPLNASFTCPNKDGTKGYGGCSYCSKLGSGDFAGDKDKPLYEQFLDISTIMKKKWPNALYILYLQANSNTYAPLDKLKELYEELITFDKKVVMLSIATRADCLDDEKITYLGELNQRMPIQIELGLQTIHESTAQLINRGHDLDCFTKIVKKLKKHQIEVVVHIINGLPFENKEMMLETVQYLNTLSIDGIKIHSLTVTQNTKMGNDYLRNPFPLLSLEEYVDITVTQIRLLNENIIIHRLSADAVNEDLIAPLWTKKKLVVMNEIDKVMRKHNYYQGDLLIR